MRESDCIRDPEQHAVWTSQNPNVVAIHRSEWLVSVRPGVFHVDGRIGTARVTDEGFVLPAGWHARIEPDSVQVMIGDSIAFVVRAYTAQGELLPIVPFSVYTPEFEMASLDKKPIVDKYSHQMVMAPAGFLAERAGRTSITGVIADQHVRADLIIKSTKTPRRR